MTLSGKESEHLYILWTTADVITSDKMLIAYATGSLLVGWWDEVTIIIWGSSPKLVAESILIQEKIKKATRAGVHFSACRACTDELGVTGKLISLGIEVDYWGDRLSKLIKTNAYIITI